MILANIDQIDKNILQELQRDGKLTNAELAGRVGLSDSPCLRRVRKLEESGFITGYHAHLDQAMAGVSFTIFVGIKVRRHANDETAPFEQWARERHEVAACFLVSGEIDYLLHVTVADLKAYEIFLTHELLANPAIDDIRSNIAVRTVKSPFGVLAALG